MDIGDIISHELLTAEEEHDSDLAKHCLRRHVPIADRGAGHHQEPDGVQVVKAPRLWPVVSGELEPGVTGVLCRTRDITMSGLLVWATKGSFTWLCTFDLIICSVQCSSSMQT